MFVDYRDPNAKLWMKSIDYFPFAISSCFSLRQDVFALIQPSWGISGQDRSNRQPQSGSCV